MFLCGFCPSDVFMNTRVDLGICNKIHDDELTKKYMASSRYMRMGYEEEFLECLQTLIGEVERKIRRNHARLALNQAHAEQSAGRIGAEQEKLKLLSDRISDLIEQAEKLGCEGRIEESQGVLKLCDQLKDERTALQESASNQLTSKEMEVCSICGAFLVVDDIPQRVEEHVSGKLHVGYAKVRDTIETVKKKLLGEDPEREARLKREREERDREKEKERREREVKREYRDDDRRDSVGKSSSHSSRSHGHHSSRRSRSRSHERRHRSRSRDRDRRRSKDRRHHSPDDSHNDNGRRSNSSR